MVTSITRNIRVGGHLTPVGGVRLSSDGQSGPPGLTSDRSNTMRTPTFVSLFGVIATALGTACSDAGTGLSDDRAAVAAAYEELVGYTDGDFGDTGAVGTTTSFAPISSSDVLDTAIAPRFWGRQRVVRGGPLPVYHREITVVGDTAWVSRSASFQGIFLVDTSSDGVFNPTSKPLADGARQRAQFVRDRTVRRG